VKISANLLRKFLPALLAIGFFLMPACTGSSIPPTPSQEIISPPFSLTLLHVGDTDAYIIPHEVMMKFNGNDTLVTMRMNGATLKAMLEKGIDAHLAAGLQPPFYEISGLRMTVELSRGAGSRITGLQLQNADGSYINIDPNGLYTLATDSSLAGDFIDSLVKNWRWLGPLTDGLKVSLEKSFVCTDAGIRDTDALTDYLRAQKNIRNLTTERMAILPTADK